MQKTDVLSIFFVFSIIAGWKVLTMANVPWWVCGAGAGGYAVVLLYDRMRKRKDLG